MRYFLNKIFKKKLHIFYRHVHIDHPNLKNREKWFSFESCFKNLIVSISQDAIPLDIDLTVMFDGDEESYGKDFLADFMRKYSQQSRGAKVEINIFKGGSDKNSSLETLSYVMRKNYSDDDWIYFLENDYLHIPDWVSKFSSLINSSIPFEYVSLYDHRDKYQFSKRFHEMHIDLKSKIYITDNHHWRTVPSTCASFLVSMRTLREDYDVLKTGLMDHQIFDILVGNKNRVLLSPIPGLSTHVMVDLMSPFIDWKKISNN